MRILYLLLIICICSSCGKKILGVQVTLSTKVLTELDIYRCCGWQSANCGNEIKDSIKIITLNKIPLDTASLMRELRDEYYPIADDGVTSRWQVPCTLISMQPIY